MITSCLIYTQPVVLINSLHVSQGFYQYDRIPSGRISHQSHKFSERVSRSWRTISVTSPVDEQETTVFHFRIKFIRDVHDEIVPPNRSVRIVV